MKIDYIAGEFTFKPETLTEEADLENYKIYCNRSRYQDIKHMFYQAETLWENLLLGEEIVKEIRAIAISALGIDPHIEKGH